MSTLFHEPKEIEETDNTTMTAIEMFSGLGGMHFAIDQALPGCKVYVYVIR